MMGGQPPGRCLSVDAISVLRFSLAIGGAFLTRLGQAVDVPISISLFYSGTKHSIS